MKIIRTAFGTLVGILFCFNTNTSFGDSEKNVPLKQTQVKKIQKGGRVLNNAQKADMILNKAFKTEISSFAQSEKEITDKGVKRLIEEKNWIKYYPDGSYASRIESVVKSTDGKVLYKTVDFISPDGGIFCLIEKNAVKKIYASKHFSDVVKKEHAMKKKFKYSMAEGEYKNIPCFVVTRQYPPGGVIDKILKKVYFIDKKDYFIYSVVEYKIDGTKNEDKPDRIKKMKADEINDKLFTVPSGYRVINCENERAFHAIFDSLKPSEGNIISSPKFSRRSCCGQ